MPEMLKELQQFFGAPTHLTARQVVEMRLSGLHFGRPYDTRGGETSDDALVVFFKTHKRVARIPANKILDELFDDAPLVGTTSPIALAAHGGIEAYCRLITVLKSAGVKLNPAMVQRHMSCFIPLEDLDRTQCEAYWQIVMAAFPNDSAAQDRVAVTSPLIASEWFLEGIAPNIALQLPRIFLDEVLPKVVRKMVTDGCAKPLNLTNCVSIALSNQCFKESLEPRPPIYTATINRLAQNLRHLTQFDKSELNSRLVDSILKGARKSTAGFDVMVALERSERLAVSEELSPDSGVNPDDLIRALDFSNSDTRDFAFVTNNIPFAESMFFQMWADIAQKANLSIAFKDIEWGNLKSSVESGQLSFGVCNNKLFDQIDRTKYEFIDNFMKFENYPVIVSSEIYSRLENYDGLDADLVDLFLTDLERSEKIYSFNIINNTQNPNGVPNPVRDIVFSNSYSRVDVEGDTDLQSAFLKMNCELDSDRICYDHSSLNSIHRLLSGDCNVAIIGGVQAAFAARSFPNRLKVVGYIDENVTIGLIFKKAVFESQKYKDNVLPSMISSWNQMCERWEAYKSKRASQKLMDYFRYFSTIADDRIGLPYFHGDRDALIHLASRHTTVLKIGNLPDGNGSLASSDGVDRSLPAGVSDHTARLARTQKGASANG